MAKGCGLSTASEVFLIFTRYINILVFLFLFALFSDEPEVFIPKYSQTAILHAAHFRRIVNNFYNGITLSFFEFSQSNQ